MEQILIQIESWWEKALLALIIYVVGYGISNLTSMFFYRLIITRQWNDNYGVKMASIIRRIIKIIVLIFIILASVNVLWLNVTFVIGGLTFAIGYAMQEILGNMFSGIMLATNPRFKIWNLVEILWSIWAFGRIESINVRNTIFTTFDRRKIIIPNQVLVKTPFKTLKSEEVIRYSLTINLQRHANITEAKNIIISAINEHPYTIEKQHTAVMIKEFTDPWLLLEVYFFFNPSCGYSIFKTKGELRQNMFEKLSKAGFTVAYPKRLLVMKEEQSK